MEYVEGGDMYHMIEKNGPLSEYDVKHYFRQIVDVLSYLHKKGICHRDIKLENIVIDQNKNIKLVDFGFAK